MARRLTGPRATTASIVLRHWIGQYAHMVVEEGQAVYAWTASGHAYRVRMPTPTDRTTRWFVRHVQWYRAQRTSVTAEPSRNQKHAGEGTL